MDGMSHLHASELRAIMPPRPEVWSKQRIADEVRKNELRHMLKVDAFVDYWLPIAAKLGYGSIAMLDELSDTQITELEKRGLRVAAAGYMDDRLEGLQSSRVAWGCGPMFILHLEMIWAGMARERRGMTGRQGLGAALWRSDLRVLVRKGACLAGGGAYLGMAAASCSGGPIRTRQIEQDRVSEGEIPEWYRPFCDVAGANAVLRKEFNEYQSRLG